jgi:ribosomal-protein-alanine N-acetyltransferase
MNNIEIVPLSLEHIDDVLKIYNLSFPTPWSRNSFQREVETNKFARYVVAKRDELILGYAGMWLILDEAHITNIAVHPEYRGIDIGNRLLEALIIMAKVDNIESMTLEVRKSNIVAQNLYIKHGFVQEGIRKEYYGDNREDAIIMWKHNI